MNVYPSQFPLRHSRLFLALSLMGMLAASSVLSGCSKGPAIPEVPSRLQTVSSGPSQVTLTDAQANEIGLQLAPVEDVHFNQTVDLPGQVQAASYLQAHVYSTAQGKALEIPVKPGETVSTGQTLIMIKSDQIGQMESDLLQQNLQNVADLKQAKVQLNFSKVALQREQKLFKDNVSARADLESAMTQYQKDKATLDAIRTKQKALISVAQQRLALFGVNPGVAARVVQHQGLYPYITIVAPRPGLLIARNINEGELVDPTKEIFTIADLSRVWLSGNVYEKDIPKIHMGQPMKVILDSQGGKVFDGRINYIGGLLDPATRTLEIRGEVTNSGLLLRPNMFARMSVNVGDARHIAVPDGALQRYDNRTFAYVQVKPHVFEERPVSVGMDNGRFTEIISGLRANDTIAVSGTLSLMGKFREMNTSSINQERWIAQN